MKKVFFVVLIALIGSSLFATSFIGGEIGGKLGWYSENSSYYGLDININGANYFGEKDMMGVAYNLSLTWDFNSICPSVTPSVLYSMKFNLNESMYTLFSLGGYASFEALDSSSVTTETGFKIDLDLGYKLLNTMDLLFGIKMEIPLYKIVGDQGDLYYGYSVSPVLGFTYTY